MENIIVNRCLQAERDGILLAAKPISSFTGRSTATFIKKTQQLETIRSSDYNGEEYIDCDPVNMQLALPSWFKWKTELLQKFQEDDNVWTLVISFVWLISSNLPKMQYRRFIDIPMVTNGRESLLPPLLCPKEARLKILHSVRTHDASKFQNAVQSHPAVTRKGIAEGRSCVYCS